tara:strand:+ start:7141 stop:7416 length:276 start_codon:yes stop_codon:yes gene_type:complete
MKITKRQLRRIIKEATQEEWDRRFQQNRDDQALAHPDHPDNQPALLDLDDYEKVTKLLESIIDKMTWSPRDSSGYDREDIIHAMKLILEEI